MKAFGSGASTAEVGGHDRVVRLGAVDVPWRLVRLRRRTIGFVVDRYGLEVRAPLRVTLAEIEAGLAEQGRWIVRTWQRVAARAGALDAARTVWRDGVTVSYRGRPLLIRVRGGGGGALPAGPGSGQCTLDFDTPPAPSVPGLDATAEPPVLVLGLDADAGPDAIRAATRRWLEAQALDAVTERAGVHAAALGVRVTRIGLSNASTRWGSAGADGAIRLHWRLVQLEPDLLDAVVAHEVAHLREMNHGPRFHRLLAGLTPDPVGARRRLRAAAASLAAF